MIVTVKARTGTAAQWTAANPVLGDGELGYERDTTKFKFGDGTTAWATLAYSGGGGGGTGGPLPATVFQLADDRMLNAVDGVLLHVTVIDDGTPSANWPNRFEFKFRPTPGSTVGEHLTSWFNEYGEFRVTPAKNNTVPFRAFTKELFDDPEHDPTVPVMEMVWARNVRTPIWGVMADGTMYTAGPIERRVPSGPTLKTGYLPLPTAASIPANTPEGTLIVRY